MMMMMMMVLVSCALNVTRSLV